MYPPPVSRRQRLGLWIASVAACGLSPVLFRLVAPWAGAAWQCVCLGAILALYATTPADAIKLPRWVSKAVIVGGMAAWPWLCTGRMTWALVAATIVVFVADHLLLTITWPTASMSVRWSKRPGVASDWLATILLWSPTTWLLLVGSRVFSEPEWALLASGYVLMMMLVLQLKDRPDRPCGWFSGRLGMATVFLGLGVVTAAAFARYGAI